MSEIIHNDDYKIFDKLAAGANKKQTRGPLGWVQVYMNDKNLQNKTPDFEGGNLVVARGREFVAQKIFAVNDFDGGSRTDWRAHQISHFAVGSGGATVNADVVTLNGPFICDTGLYEPVSLGNSSFLEEPSAYNGGDDVHVYIDAVKPILTDGSITLESDEYTGGSSTCNYYTKMKCVCSVVDGEPATIAAGAAVEISEAGLYFTNGTDAQMFSHICFPPKWKEKESNITIIWYILC